MVTALPAADVLSDAHSVPLKGSVNGTATIDLSLSSHNLTGDLIIPVSSTATGNVSHLGRVTMTETHITTILAAKGYQTSTVTMGKATVTAANGDKLYLDFGGTGVRTKNGFDDTFWYCITGGSGRFENATGKGTILSSDGGVDGSGPLVQTAPYVFNLDGVISAVGSNKHS